MEKKVIFFDADGTLWYPKSTRRNKAPHWVYVKNHKPEKYLPLLTLTPSLATILGKLKKKGLVLVALSTHPHSLKEANEHMASKITHFKIKQFFDRILTSRPYPSGKGRAMISFLKKSKIPKSRALLVGDSYLYDYKSAKGVGIDCLLIKTPYLRPPGKKVKNTINNLNELLKYF